MRKRLIRYSQNELFVRTYGNIITDWTSEKKTNDDKDIWENMINEDKQEEDDPLEQLGRR